MKGLQPMYEHTIDQKCYFISCETRRYRYPTNNFIAAKKVQVLEEQSTQETQCKPQQDMYMKWKNIVISA